MTSPLRQSLARCLTMFLFLSLLESRQVVAQAGDGGAASGVQPGDIGSDTPSAGAAGADVGVMDLSRGATIAIAVVVSVVVILGGKSSLVGVNSGVTVI